MRQQTPPLSRLQIRDGELNMEVQTREEQVVTEKRGHTSGSYLNPGGRWSGTLLL